MAEDCVVINIKIEEHIYNTQFCFPMDFKEAESDLTITPALSFKGVWP